MENGMCSRCHTEFKGIALKSPDIVAIRACSDCHQYFDGALSRPEYNELAVYGLARTLKALVHEGVINID